MDVTFHCTHVAAALYGRQCNATDSNQEELLTQVFPNIDVYDQGNLCIF